MSTLSRAPQTGAHIARFYVLDLQTRWHRATVRRTRVAVAPDPDAALLQSCPDYEVIVIDCSVWSFRYLLTEILSKRCCRRQFIRSHHHNINALAIVLRLQPPAKELIDYGW